MIFHMLIFLKFFLNFLKFIYAKFFKNVIKIQTTWVNQLIKIVSDISSFTKKNCIVTDMLQVMVHVSDIWLFEVY